MKKIIVFVLCLVGLAVAVQAETPAAQPQSQGVVHVSPAAFKARHKMVKQLIKKYKKAPEAQKPAIKEELAKLVSEQVDAQFVYMKARIAAERANLDNWEQKIQQDEQNLEAVKAQRVEDLLSGEAQKKHKAAKKAWKKQMKAVK